MSNCTCPDRGLEFCSCPAAAEKIERLEKALGECADVLRRAPEIANWVAAIIAKSQEEQQP